MRIYVAGPRTGIEDYNRAAFARAANWLRTTGHYVVSPTELDGAEDGMAKGGSGATLPEATYLRGLRKCVAAMLGCDAVAVLHGWEDSRGAVLEVQVARALGLSVLSYPTLAPIPPAADSVAHPRHPNSDRFHAILAELGALHDRKQYDYGRDDDPFANVRASSEWGIPEWVGAMVRATDKVRRLQTLARRGTLANESARDAFMDLAVYSVIACVLFEEDSAPPA